MLCPCLYGTWYVSITGQVPNNYDDPNPYGGSRSQLSYGQDSLPPGGGSGINYDDPPQRSMYDPDDTTRGPYGQDSPRNYQDSPRNYQDSPRNYDDYDRHPSHLTNGDDPIHSNDPYGTDPRNRYGDEEPPYNDFSPQRENPLMAPPPDGYHLDQMRRSPSIGSHGRGKCYCRH